MGISVPPFEADPQSVVNPNAALTLAIPLEGFQPQTRQVEIAKRSRRIQQFQPDPG
jgi:hypothetical protein